jgi:cobalamin biosynthetic protein CobC
VREIGGLDAIADAGLVVVTNPNNPDGRLLAKADLLATAKHLQSHGGMLVVDEAFMDVGPLGASLAPEVARGNIVVLRSFGKFFGLAGLRLGFALAAPPLTARLAALLGPWAVSAPALAAGTAALSDLAWIETTRRQLAQATARLDAILSGSGLEIIGGTTLFRLTRTRAAHELFHHLGRAGILVRAFPDHALWLRFGLPAAELDWQRLQIAMAAFRDKV